MIIALWGQKSEVKMCYFSKKVENMPFFYGPTYKRTPNPKVKWSDSKSSWAYSWVPSLYKHRELYAHVIISETLG